MYKITTKHSIYIPISSIICCFSVLISILLLPTAIYAQSINEITFSDLNIQAIADKVIVDEKNKLIKLEGNVKISYKNIRVSSDKIVLNLEKEELVATGNIEVYEANNFLMQTESYKSNFSFTKSETIQLSLRLKGSVKLFAYKWTKESNELEKVEKAIFTTCKTCDISLPLWQFNAEEVVWNKKNKRLYLYNSIFKFYNVPLLYVPYLNIPDPTVSRASGFLIPDYSLSKTLGFFVKTPFYWAINKSSDITISPIISFTELPGFEMEFRKKAKNTYIQTLLALHPKVKNDKYSSEFSYYVTNSIDIDLPYNFKFESFNSYAHKFIYHPRFMESDLSSILKNELNLTRFQSQSWIDISVNRYDNLNDEIDKTLTSYLLPSILFENWIELPNRFGDLSLNIESTYQFSNDNTQYRLTGEVEYYYELTGLGGLIWQNAINLRGDVFYNKQATGKKFTLSDWRILPDISLNLSYGVLNIFDKMELTEQPLVGIFEPYISINYLPAVYSKGWADSNIVNMDTLTINQHIQRFTLTNRASGYDKVETGLRIDYGSSLNLNFKDYRLLLSVGQSYRPIKDDFLFKETGIKNGFSRVMIETELASEILNTSLKVGLNLNNKVKDDDNAIYYVSWYSGLNFDNYNIGTTMLYRKPDIALNLNEKWTMLLGSDISLSKNWNLKLRSSLDLLKNFSLTKGIITLEYTNPCYYLSIKAYQYFNSNGSLSENAGINISSGLVFPYDNL